MSRSAKVFNTKLTQLLGIRTPVVLPPMAGAAGGKLAGQVTSAGGFGFLSASYGATPADFKQQLSFARSALQTPDSINSTAVEFPVGVGYLAWQLETPKSTVLELLPIALEHNIQAVWFAFGENLPQWIQFVRDHDRRLGNDKKTLIFVQISTVKEALVAANEWKVDCIVAQGVESGGHGAGYALPLQNLLPLVLAAMPADSPPILAAGGLANGAHLASVLTLGAAGAVFGTRFLFANDSLYSDLQRKALVSATSEMSVRSMAWDSARGTLGWPAGVDGRGLRNSTVEDFENGLAIEALQSKFQEAVKNQDIDRLIVWAGTGSIVEELHIEAIEHLETAKSLVM
ncbi:CBM1 domain-containing protein [Mycena sanguinolenta]|uniref:CBM1 domain-containing protein n=1 Tax=Mycena sanguinolenta TaxID=230812 RepID=A0A8H6Z197_9AGAR|nr:CBM1 domain-containing protein [Mycena sanguinolenta]